MDGRHDKQKTDGAPGGPPIDVPGEEAKPLQILEELDDKLSKTDEEAKRVEAYTTPFEIHADFIRDLIPIFGGHPDDVAYQCTQKPSALRDRLIDRATVSLELALMKTAPLEKDGKTIALSMDSNGNPISEERFYQMKKEIEAEMLASAGEDITSMYGAVVKCNRRMRAFAIRHGQTTGEMYIEINARFFCAHRNSPEDSGVKFDESIAERTREYMKSHPSSWWNRFNLVLD